MAESTQKPRHRKSVGDDHGPPDILPEGNKPEKPEATATPRPSEKDKPNPNDPNLKRKRVSK
jgi:hypothetical protein